MSGDAYSFVKLAEKSLKTSLLKWSPDYDEAIENYKKAAQIFSNNKKSNEAADTYLKMSEIYLKQESEYNAAKALERAANIYRNINDYEKMEKMFERSALLMRQAGAHDSAIVMLKNVASDLLNQSMFENAAKFYESAGDVAIGESKYSEAANFMNQAAGCLVKLEKYPQAKALLRKHIDCVIENSNASGSSSRNLRFGSPAQICGKAVVTIILIELKRDDVIAAQKVLKEAIEKYGFGSTDDVHPVTKLLDALESEDGEAARQAIQSPTFVNLELHFSRLAKDVKMPAIENNTTASQLKNLPVQDSTDVPIHMDDDEDIL